MTREQLPTHIPAVLRNYIDTVIGNDDYSLYVGDGQTSDHGCDRYHDAVTIEESEEGLFTVRQFRMKPDGTLEHWTLPEN
jgi:putative NADPH-quinone reductase